MIHLGDTVRDKVTGFKGLAICRTEWLHGCVRFGVQPQELHEGKPIESIYFDEPQLEVVSSTGPHVPPQGGGGRDGEKKAMGR